MDEDGPRERLRENATAVASTVVTGVWLAALLTGQGWWLGALILGYVVVVPVVAVLYGDEDDRREWWDDWVGNGSDANEREHQRQRADPRAERDALETLRDRYARGELTDEQFERKLEKLLETETLEAVEDRRLERERAR
ncbi:SHOCT domain-containing protein [Halalkalicoccus ordinarius]|uniref:SHOCT domain-containing protein n=1 Tax=Halalkalicoccus ordinarius TaxID=3116651 RepID=UPI00300E7416